MVNRHGEPVRIVGTQAYPEHMNSVKKGSSPVAMAVGGLLAVVVGWILLRWVLGTIVFLAKAVILVVLVALVLSAVARFTGRGDRRK